MKDNSLNFALLKELGWIILIIIGSVFVLALIEKLTGPLG